MERLGKEREIVDSRLHKINLKEADGYVITDQQVIAKKLKRMKLFSKDLLYSAFGAEGIKRTLDTGIYRLPNDPEYNLVFCCNLREDKNGKKYIGTSDENRDLMYYMGLRAEGYNRGAFAIYLPEYFEEIPCDGYQLKKGVKMIDALKAVVEVEDFWDY